VDTPLSPRLGDELHEVVGARWRERASCRGLDPARFFPERGAPSAPIDACIACPVAIECLRYALDAHEGPGTWAGTSPRARQHMRRRALREGIELDDAIEHYVAELQTAEAC
jgi:WhiB family redox-sensing transcriptional regulator